MPLAAAPRPLANRRLAGLRAWPVDGFDAVRIYYLVDVDLVVFARVLHDRRHVDAVLEATNPN
jgi:plasmid stabilization system protein ParE